jgi:DNA-binding transcriptional MerR regulator
MAVRYRIGEFAELGGVSTKTLRFYDEIGLLRPSSVDPRTRYRFYRAQQLEELASILALKEIGVSLAEVRNLISNGRPKRERKEILTDLKKTVQKSIQTAKRSLDWIDTALRELDEDKRPIPVVVKRRPGVLVASIRARVQSYGEIERYERELMHELPPESVSELRGALWHRCADSGCLEGEPFVALKQRLPVRSVYQVRQLDPATLACAYSRPDNDSAERAYDAIRKWMSLRGYQLAGPKREIYFDQLLEIQFPLKSA